MDVGAFPRRFHSPAKPGKSRFDRQSGDYRSSAVYRNLLGVDRRIWDCRRGCRLDPAMRSGSIGVLWLSGMKRGDFLLLLPPAALMAASLIMARVLGSNPVITFPVAVFIGAMSFVLGYSFSEDWRSLTLAQINRARVFLSNLTNRVRRSPSVK